MHKGGSAPKALETKIQIKLINKPNPLFVVETIFRDKIRPSLSKAMDLIHHFPLWLPVSPKPFYVAGTSDVIYQGKCRISEPKYKIEETNLKLCRDFGCSFVRSRDNVWLNGLERHGGDSFCK
jgi:hypothetical protein